VVRLHVDGDTVGLCLASVLRIVGLESGTFSLFLRVFLRLMGGRFHEAIEMCLGGGTRISLRLGGCFAP
jgi:hypothetical protein